LRAIAVCDPENNHMDEGAIAMTISKYKLLLVQAKEKHIHEKMGLSVCCS
jgi:hypothetical protein